MLFGDGPKGNKFANAGVGENNIDSPLHLSDCLVKTIEVSVRVEDGGAFTTPWSARQVYQRSDEGPLIEMVCAENNANYFSRDIVPIPSAAKPDF